MVEVVDSADMLQDGALWAAGAARREDDVAHVGGAGARSQGVVWLLSQERTSAVKLQASNKQSYKAKALSRSYAQKKGALGVRSELNHTPGQERTNCF